MPEAQTTVLLHASEDQWRNKGEMISIALTDDVRYFGSLLRTWQSLPVLLGVVEQCNAQHGGRQHALFGRKSFEQHELFVGQSGADLIGSLLSHQYFVAKDTSCIDYSVTFDDIR